MSVYFIHAEVELGSDGSVVGRVSDVIVAPDACDAVKFFLCDNEKIIELTNRGRNVVIDKVEKVE